MMALAFFPPHTPRSVFVCDFVDFAAEGDDSGGESGACFPSMSFGSQ